MDFLAMSPANNLKDSISSENHMYYNTTIPLKFIQVRNTGHTLASYTPNTTTPSSQAQTEQTFPTNVLNTAKDIAYLPSNNRSATPWK